MLVDDVLALEVHRDPHRGAGRPLAAARLEEVERPLLDRELDVLHVLVVPLEPGGDGAELVVDLRRPLAQGLDRERGAGPCHDVLALGVRQELRVEARLARARIPRESDPRAGIVAEVAEHHRHDRHRGAPVLGDPVDAPVLRRLLGEPGAEHRIDGPAQLVAHVLRERGSRARRDLVLVGLHELPQLAGRDIGVGRRAEARLHGVERCVEDLALDVQHHNREHRDEPAVAIPGEALVARPGRQPLDGGVVESQVQDRLHHPGHRHARPRPHRHQERTVAVAEARVGHLLEPREMLQNLLPEALGPFAAGALGVDPGLGGDGEPRRHRDAEIGHLGQLTALAAEQVSHHGRAFRLAGAEEVDVLGRIGRRAHVLIVRDSGPALGTCRILSVVAREPGS